MTNISVGQMKPYQTFYLALNTLVEQTLQYQELFKFTQTAKDVVLVCA